MRAFLMLLALGVSMPVWAACFTAEAVTGLAPVQVARVYDGDTLALVDGRKVRLLNINTPELARDGQSDQAFARQATEAARQWLSSRNQLFLRVDDERKDRYGRWLAHVLDNKGNSLAVHLLQMGLAEPIAVPPNLALAGCYFALAEAPKAQKLGLWAVNGARDVALLSQGGYQRLGGTISSITKTRAGDYWLELQGRLAIQIRKQDLSYFTDFPAGFPLASRVEVVGWVVDRSGSSAVQRKGYTAWTLQVRTPYAITVVEP